MTARLPFPPEPDTKTHQMLMAHNVARLKTKPAKQQQVRMLVESLKRSIRSK